MKIFAVLILFAVVACTTSNKNNALISGDLKLREKVSGTLSVEEPIIYHLTLDSSSFVFGQVDQISVDVVVNIKDSAENIIESFDGPGVGIENFMFEVSGRGKYSIEVVPFEKNSGDYSIELIKVEPIESSPNKRIDQLFTQYSGETPGATIAVMKDGEIVYKNGFGLANLEYDIPNTPSTIYHIASVSKQFTTFAILLLEKEGKLSLDDDIRKYITEVPDFGKTITLRHLATHTSGLRDQWNLLAMAGWRLDDVITKEHVLKLVSKQKELNFEPGEKFLYCNTGFTLLAEVVARVSSQTFAEYTSENIFEPLQMTNTLFYDDHEKIVKNRSYSYKQGSHGFKKSVLSYANVGATSLFTTVEDLSLWANNFEKPVVGDSEVIMKMKEQGILNNGDTIDYALGQSVGKYKGLNMISHGGGDAGFRTFLARIPDQSFSVSVFSNDASFNAGGMAMKVIDVYLSDKLDVAQKPKVEDTKDNTVSIDNKTLKEYVGEFELQPGFILSITEDKGELFAQATGQQKLKLIAISITEFTAKEVDAKISFHRDDNNKVNLLKLHQGGVFDAPRLNVLKDENIDLNEFTGEFYSDELSTKYTLTLVNDTIIAKHIRLPDSKITPVNADDFRTDKWYLGRIEFVRDKNKNIKGFKASSGRVLNLWFEKVK